MLHLDDLDVRIFREFNGPRSPHWNVRESFTAVARRLGVDEETVRLRVARLRDHGVIPSWRIAINPRLLGYEETGLDLEIEDESVKPEVLARLRSLPGITQIADFQGSGMLAILWRDRHDVLPWFRKRVDPIGAWKLRAYWTSPFPEPTVKMRTIDWKILAAMRDDARKDLRTVASMLRTTVRTVQRRLLALNEGKAAFVVGTPNVDRMAGLMCNYLVYCPDDDRKRAADATALRQLPRIGTYDTDSAHYSMFGGSCENLSQAEQVLARLRSLYEAGTVRLAIVREIFIVDDWLDGLLRKQARPAPGPTSRARVR
jgi:DNA-binding Lrp family transcriptional regulator